VEGGEISTCRLRGAPHGAGLGLVVVGHELHFINTYISQTNQLSVFQNLKTLKPVELEKEETKEET
jgi:hypothetical protein